MTHRLLALLALATLCLSATCDPAMVLGPSASRADSYDKRVSYARGSCYGRCEVFDFHVYDNGLLVFEGKRFTDKPGTWEKSIDRRRLKGLLDTLQAADFPNYPRSFRGQVADAATVSVSYTDVDGQTYDTSFKDYAPEELLTISQRLNDLAHLPNYRQVSDTIANRLHLRPVAAKERQEIIVRLREGVAAETWVVAYGKQNVAVKERISPNGNYYVILADPNVMAADELLEYIRQDDKVVSAQLNQAVSPRRR